MEQLYHVFVMRCKILSSSYAKFRSSYYWYKVKKYNTKHLQMDHVNMLSQMVFSTEAQLVECFNRSLPVTKLFCDWQTYPTGNPHWLVHPPASERVH